MPRVDSVEALLADARRLTDCREARAAWVRRMTAAWGKAQEEMDKRCSEAVDRLDREAFERLCDEEEAKVDKFRAELLVAANEDRWPKALHCVL